MLPTPAGPAAMLPDGPAIRAGAVTGPAMAAGCAAGPAKTAPGSRNYHIITWSHRTARTVYYKARSIG